MWSNVATFVFAPFLLYYGQLCAEGAIVTSNPQSITAAVNTTVAFNCTIFDTKLDIRWYITPPNSIYPRPWPQDRNVLEGIVLYEVNATRNITRNGTNAMDSSSTLYVAARNQANGTTLQCAVVSSTGEKVASEMATLYVYDRPPSPTNLSTRVLGPLRLVLSWNPVVTVHGGYTWYRVHVRDLTTSADVLNSPVANGSTSYVYQHSKTYGNVCNLYRFAVLAENAAGLSSPRYLPVTNIPSEPVLSNVTSLVYLSPEACVHILVKPVVGCPNFTIQGYHVHLEDLVSMQALELPPHPSVGYGMSTEIVINSTAGLRTNTKYAVSVSGFNVVGTSSNFSLLLYTTDVQSSTITGSDYQLNVTCSFAEGSLAKGCVVLLENSGKVLQQKFPKMNLTATGVIETEYSVDNYNISVVDWEEDGSIGPLMVPVNLNLYATSEKENSEKAGRVADSTPFYIPLLIGVLGAIFVILCTAILIALILLFSGKKRITHHISNSMFDKGQTAAISSTTEERLYDTVAEDLPEYSGLRNKHSTSVTTDDIYSHINKCPSYAVLEKASGSNMGSPLYSEISPLPHYNACHPAVVKNSDPQPYLCVSQVFDSHEGHLSNCACSSVTEI